MYLSHQIHENQSVWVGSPPTLSAFFMIGIVLRIYANNDGHMNQHAQQNSFVGALAFLRRVLFQACRYSLLAR